MEQDLSGNNGGTSSELADNSLIWDKRSFPTNSEDFPPLLVNDIILSICIIIWVQPPPKIGKYHHIALTLCTAIGWKRQQSLTSRNVPNKTNWGNAVRIFSYSAFKLYILYNICTFYKFILLTECHLIHHFMITEHLYCVFQIILSLLVSVSVFQCNCWYDHWMAPK